MDLGIKGKKAIVCAASKGLGKGSAMALAREGVDVTICARGETRSTRMAPPGTGLEPHAPVKSADRALEVLECLAEHGESTLGELRARLGFPKSSLHALLRTLLELENFRVIEAENAQS